VVVVVVVRNLCIERNACCRVVGHDLLDLLQRGVSVLAVVEAQ
jgi:hypothetical protein